MLQQTRDSSPRDELGLPPPELHLVHGLRQCLRRRRGYRTLLLQQARTDPESPPDQPERRTSWDFATLWALTRTSATASATRKGSFPYINSGHPGGFNVTMCDGSVHYLKNIINGTVFAKLVTSAGSKLPRPPWQQRLGGLSNSL